MNETHPSIEQIVDHLRRELPASDDAAVQTHLAGCVLCQERRNEEVALTQALRAYAAARERDLPQSVAAGIRNAAAQRESAESGGFLRRLFRPAFVLPVAAAAAIAIYFGLNGRHYPAQSTAVEASFYVDNHAAAAAAVPFSDGEPIPATLTSSDEAR